MNESYLDNNFFYLKYSITIQSGCSVTKVKWIGDLNLDPSETVHWKIMLISIIHHSFW